MDYEVEGFLEEVVYEEDFKVKYPYSGVFHRWMYKEFPEFDVLESAVKTYRNAYIFSWDISPEWCGVTYYD